MNLRMLSLRQLFFALVVRPLMLVVLGAEVRNAHRLPTEGPALVVANHNSHLDALMLMSLFPLEVLPKVRPVGASDYFFTNRILRWFTTEVLGMIPLDRRVRGDRARALGPVEDALARGEIVILFPEGTRGEPEVPAPLKSGVAYLAGRAPAVPVHPVHLRGLGSVLPKGAALPVPRRVDVWCGGAFTARDAGGAFMEELAARFALLRGSPDLPRLRLLPDTHDERIAA